MSRTRRNSAAENPRLCANLSGLSQNLHVARSRRTWTCAGSTQSKLTKKIRYGPRMFGMFGMRRSDAAHHATGGHRDRHQNPPASVEATHDDGVHRANPLPQAPANYAAQRQVLDETIVRLGAHSGDQSPGRKGRTDTRRRRVATAAQR